MTGQPTRILFLGKRGDELSARALQFIQLHFPNTEAHLGVRGDPFPPVGSRDEFDFVLSYLCPWVVPAAILERARSAGVNFHPGSPEYPGIGCTNFAIYEGARTYGVTCHHMAAQVDTGSIIRVVRFPVHPSDSVLTLTHRAHVHLASLFYEIADLIIGGAPMPAANENWTRQPFRRSQLNALCRLTREMSEEEIRRRIRATTFPGYSCASFDWNGTSRSIEDLPEGTG